MQTPDHQSPLSVSPVLRREIGNVGKLISTKALQISVAIGLIMSGCADLERRPLRAPRQQSSRPSTSLRPSPATSLGSQPTQDASEPFLNSEFQPTPQQRQAAAIIQQHLNEQRQRRIRGLPHEIRLLEDELLGVDANLERLQSTDQYSVCENRRAILKTKIAALRHELHLHRVETGEEAPGF